MHRPLEIEKEINKEPQEILTLKLQQKVEIQGEKEEVHNKP
jgi:hypothetical protein